MRKLIYTAFGAHTPEAPPAIHKPAWKIPPALTVPSGFVLDFTPLVVVDRLIIDRTSYTYVLESPLKYFESLRKSLTLLITEGFVEIEDFGNVLNQHTKDLVNVTDSELVKAVNWLPAIQKQMDIWRDSQNEWQAMMGTDYDEKTIPSSYGVYCYLKSQNLPLDEQNIQRLTKLFYSKRAQWNGKAKHELHGILRPYLSYLSSNLALSESLQAPLLDWIDMGPLYEKKYNETGQILGRSPLEKHIMKAQQLFRVALPELIPETPKQIVQFLRDKRIEDLRKVIDDAVQTGQDFSPEWGRRMLIAAMDAEIKMNRMRTLITWGGRTISSIPLPGTGYLAMAAEELANNLAERHNKDTNKWLYSLFETRKTKQ